MLISKYRPHERYFEYLSDLIFAPKRCFRHVCNLILQPKVLISKSKTVDLYEDADCCTEEIKSQTPKVSQKYLKQGRFQPAYEASNMIGPNQKEGKQNVSYHIGSISSS